MTGKPPTSEHRVADYVSTVGYYAAIYDEASPANVEDFMRQELAFSRQEIDALGKDAALTLFVFNDRLVDRAKRGELLAWTLVLDGVFRTVIELGEPIGPEASASPPIDSLGTPHETNLVCPTGRLVVGCLSRMGQQQSPVATVEPGVYRACITRDEQEEAKHQMLEAISEYPPGEGPDWKLLLRRIQM